MAKTIGKIVTISRQPAFSVIVQIPTPGDLSASLEITFKRRARTEFEDWFSTLRDRSIAGQPGKNTARENLMADVETILDIATGWELEEPFDSENIAELCECYPGAASAILSAYLSEQSAGKLGNSVR